MLGALAALAGICAALLWLAPTGFLPRLELARATWKRQDLRHYQMTARWTYGTVVNGPWTFEVRDGRVLSGRDVRDRRAMTRAELRLAEQNLVVDQLFEALITDVRPSVANTPRFLFARGIASFSPRLRNLIDRCAARLPNVRYHPELGYPIGITVPGSPCYRASEWTVLVTELTPLP
jgi:hypothetical protein